MIFLKTMMELVIVLLPCIVFSPFLFQETCLISKSQILFTDIGNYIQMNKLPSPLSIQFDTLSTNLSDDFISPEQNEIYRLAKTYFEKNDNLSPSLINSSIKSDDPFLGNPEVELDPVCNVSPVLTDDRNNDNRPPSNANTLNMAYDMLMNKRIGSGDDTQSSLKDGDKYTFSTLKYVKESALDLDEAGVQKRDPNMLVIDRALYYAHASILAGVPIDFANVGPRIEKLDLRDDEKGKPECISKFDGDNDVDGESVEKKSVNSEKENEEDTVDCQGSDNKAAQYTEKPVINSESYRIRCTKLLYSGSIRNDAGDTNKKNRDVFMLKSSEIQSENTFPEVHNASCGRCGSRMSVVGSARVCVPKVLVSSPQSNEKFTNDLNLERFYSKPDQETSGGVGDDGQDTDRYQKSTGDILPLKKMSVQRKSNSKSKMETNDGRNLPKDTQNPVVKDLDVNHLKEPTNVSQLSFATFTPDTTDDSKNNMERVKPHKIEILRRRSFLKHRKHKESATGVGPVDEDADESNRVKRRISMKDKIKRYYHSTSLVRRLSKDNRRRQ